MNPTLIKAYVASSAIRAGQIVKFGDADGHVVPSTGADDLSIGVADVLDVGAGDRLDVIRAGIAQVKFGGDVARGEPVTANADGCAVRAAAGNHIIGFAEENTASGDVAPVLLAFGKY